MRSAIYLKMCKFSLQFGWFGIDIYVQSEPKLSHDQKQPWDMLPIRSSTMHHMCHIILLLL